MSHKTSVVVAKLIYRPGVCDERCRPTKNEFRLRVSPFVEVEVEN
jgi:hypothetical protein